MDGTAAVLRRVELFKLQLSHYPANCVTDHGIVATLPTPPADNP